VIKSLQRRCGAFFFRKLKLSFILYIHITSAMSTPRNTETKEEEDEYEECDFNTLQLNYNHLIDENNMLKDGLNELIEKFNNLVNMVNNMKKELPTEQT